MATGATITSLDPTDWTIDLSPNTTVAELAALMVAYDCTVHALPDGGVRLTPRGRPAGAQIIGLMSEPIEYPRPLFLPIDKVCLCNRRRLGRKAHRPWCPAYLGDL